MATLCKGEYYG